MFHVVLRILLLVIYIIGLITSVGEERANYSAIVFLYYVLLFGGVSSSSWFL